MNLHLLPRHTNTSSRKGCLVPRELGVPDQRSLGAIHHQRVSDTPRVFARAAQVHHHSQQGTTISSAGGSVQTEGERGSSPSAAVRSSHNQSDLCHPQKRRRLETDYRPEIPELPYSTASLQDGGPVHAAKHHQSGVVHGEIGPKGCVLNHPCGPRILEPSNLPSRSTTQLDAVPVPPIRALYRTIHLFKSYKACNPVPTSMRHTPNYLSRRFVTGSSTKDQLLVDLSTAIWLLTSLGFLINIPKSITAPTCHLEFLGFIVDTDNMVISLPAHKLHCIQKEASHLLSLDRIPMRTLACFIGTLVATKPAVWTGPLHYRALQDMKIRSLRQHPHYQGSVSLSKEARVDLQWWCSELPSHCSAPIWKPEASTVIESDASKLGWGGSLPRGTNWWQVDTRGDQVPHQLFGAQSNVSGLAVLSEGQNRYSSTGQVRQSHCNSLFEQAWQSIEIPTVSVGPEDLGVVPPTSDYTTCRVSGREGQCLGRLGVLPPQQQRLATPIISLRCCPPPPWSFYNRPICEQNECSAAKLLQLETRPTGKSGRCLFNILVARPALSLPSLQPDWQSTVEDFPGRGRLCLSNSPNLASSGVVLPGIENVSEESYPTPHETGFAPESRSEAPSSNPGESDVFSRMVCLRQAFSTQGFSERVTELLLHSWRSDTHAAYNSAWSKWCAGRQLIHFQHL